MLFGFLRCYLEYRNKWESLEKMLCNEHETFRGYYLFDVLQLTVVMPIELEEMQKKNVKLN